MGSVAEGLDLRSSAPAEVVGHPFRFRHVAVGVFNPDRTPDFVGTVFQAQDLTVHDVPLPVAFFVPQMRPDRR